MKRMLVACACLLGFWAVPSAEAHHSMAGFDRAKTQTLVGTVKQFKWANPHSWIELEVPNDKGGIDVWNAEMTAPGILARGGWKSTLLKPGDKVTIVVRPLLSGEPGGLFVSVTLADGQTYTERGVQPAAAK
ncbi:MAG: hypothetical protein LAP40_00695 [Acidobacteriia bacterium]|nr:hypothetical protein [Terriglobia bacterium]